MKKLTAILLVLLLFVMTGCSSGEENTNDPNGPLVFTAETIYDEEVTSEEIFGEYDVTVVKIWGVFCGPCRAEMPANEEMYQTLKAEGIGMVGVVVDGNTDKEGAIELTSENNTTYDSIILNEEMAYYPALNPYSVPYTIFVDREGNVIDEGFAGALRQAQIIEIAKTLNSK